MPVWVWVGLAIIVIQFVRAAWYYLSMALMMNEREEDNDEPS